MSVSEFIIAILAGIVQGIVEWLPISSQGNLSLVLTLVGIRPDIVLQLALFLQLGTTVSSSVYYRDEITEALEAAPTWRPRTAFDGANAVTSFLLVACLATGLVGIPLYVMALDLASEVTGGVFILVIGILLVLTGIAQLVTETFGIAAKSQPTFRDAILVGALQGLAILPGVSRSGITTSGLLFRGYDGTSAFKLSFLLSIPAGLGAGLVSILGSGGLPGISIEAALVALLTSAIVGYVSIDILMRIAETLPFWLICFGLGGLAIVGGGANVVI